MENLKEYKSKYEYINNFFLSNKIILMTADTNKKDKAIFQEIDYDDNKFTCVIMDNQVSDMKRFDMLKTIAFNIINKGIKSNYLYVNKRYNIENEIILSKKAHIKIKRIDKKTKNALIIYNFFRIKDLINQQGDNFYKQYKSAKSNEILSKILL